MSEDMHDLGAEGYPSGVLHGRDTQRDAEVVQLQRDHASEYIGMTEALHHDTQRKILYALVNGLGEVSYYEIEAITTVSRRSLRKHVSALEEQNIVKRINSRSHIIAFRSYEIRVLAQHLIYCYEEQLQV